MGSNDNLNPLGLINDMQMSLYNGKHWHALSHSLHFVRQEGRLAATHLPSPARKSGSRLPIHVFNSVCLGLVPGQIDSPYLNIQIQPGLKAKLLLTRIYDLNRTINLQLYSTNQLTLEHIHATFEGKAKLFQRKIICKQSKLRVNLILDRADSLYIRTPKEQQSYSITFKSHNGS